MNRDKLDVALNFGSFGVGGRFPGFRVFTLLNTMEPEIQNLLQECISDLLAFSRLISQIGQEAVK